MPQFLGFGSGKDGVKTVSGTEDINTRTSCSGTSGTKVLTVASTTGFSAGDYILIHQSRGTGVGQWEINKIDTVGSGQLNLVLNLEYTYTDSGASQAQCVRIPEYKSLTVSAGNSLSPATWDGNVGGITVFMCSGKADIAGSINANGKGYAGGAGVPAAWGYDGEGTVGAGTQGDGANNGSGGGGGSSSSGSKSAGGGGGGHANAGQNGTAGTGETPGTGGSTSGSSDLVTMTFGGGGGGGGRGAGVTGNAGSGNSGGGIIVIFSRILIVTGSISNNGLNGESGTGEGSAGGGGAGGSNLMKTVNGTLGTNLITATAGLGGAMGGGGNGGNGGNGSVGRNRIEACSRTGSANPAASEVIGGLKWCGGLAAVL